MELQDKRILSADEASEYTGYGKEYLLRLCKNGVIPSSNPSGRKVFIEREKLEAWMMSKPKSAKPLKEIIDEAMHKAMLENAKS